MSISVRGRVRAAWLAWLVVLAGCGSDCSCGGSVTTSTSSSTSTSTPLPPLPEKAPGRTDLGNWLEPKPEEAEALAELQKALGGGDAGLQALPTQVSPESLAEMLADRLGRFSADGDATQASVRLGSAQAPVATRQYRDGKRMLYLKITDASAAPQTVQRVLDLLTRNEERAGSYRRGVVVRGQPGVFTYAPQHQSAKATLLVERRLLVEMRISPTTDPEETRTVLEGLDWSSVVPASAATR